MGRGDDGLCWVGLHSDAWRVQRPWKLSLMSLICAWHCLIDVTTDQSLRRQRIFAQGASDGYKAHREQLRTSLFAEVWPWRELSLASWTRFSDSTSLSHHRWLAICAFALCDIHFCQNKRINRNSSPINHRHNTICSWRIWRLVN